MNLRRLTAIARKEFIHVLRDRRSLGMALAVPIVLLLLYGYALTLDVDDVPMIVWDQSETAASREFISRFAGSRYFSLRAYARDYNEMVSAIDAGRVLTALTVPRDFAQLLDSGRPASVQLILDGSDSNTATLALSYAESVVTGYTQEISLKEIRRHGGPALRLPLEARPRVWYNADLESRNFLVPGLIAVIMMVIAALLTSLTVAREWERGTMEQLISTPVRSRELILGKLIPYLVIGEVDVLLAVLLGQFLFRVPLRGSVLLLFVMAMIFLVGTMSLGILVSITAKNQLLANQMAMMATYVPSFLLSGFVFPIANMPRAVQVLTYLVPARFFIVIMKGIYLKGVGLKILFVEALFLTLFAALMVTLATSRFKKKLT
jgi:ABC-2 type transport system permease protein